MPATLTYINEDGFEMDGTCVPVRLTDATIDAMAEQGSAWWQHGCSYHPGTGEEILWGKWDGETFTHDWPKKGDAILVTTAQLQAIHSEIEFLIALWEDADWDADWTYPSERQQYRFAWQQRGRSLKVNRDRVAKLIARCEVK
jgi:hypothetical protein